MVVIATPRVTTQKDLTTVPANQDFMGMEKNSCKGKEIYKSQYWSFNGRKPHVVPD